MDKNELRREMKIRRREMSDAEVCVKSGEIVASLLNSSFYKSHQHILAYISQDNEVETTSFIEQAIKDGKNIYAPKVHGQEMEFYRIKSLAELEKGAFGILEPTVTSEMFVANSGLVIVPGEAFAKDGTRIGYGGGFYDKYLAKHEGLTTVALAYDMQIVDGISAESHDMKMQYIITENDVLSTT